MSTKKLFHDVAIVYREETDGSYPDGLATISKGKSVTSAGDDAQSES